MHLHKQEFAIFVHNLWSDNGLSILKYCMYSIASVSKDNFTEIFGSIFHTQMQFAATWSKLCNGRKRTHCTAPKCISTPSSEYALVCMRTDKKNNTEKIRHTFAAGFSLLLCWLIASTDQPFNSSGTSCRDCKKWNRMKKCTLTHTQSWKNIFTWKNLQTLSQINTERMHRTCFCLSACRKKIRYVK